MAATPVPAIRQIAGSWERRTFISSPRGRTGTFTKSSAPTGCRTGTRASPCGRRTPSAWTSWVTSRDGAGPRPPARPVGATGVWQGVVAGLGRRPALQVPHPLAPGRLHRRQGRPVRVRHRAPARHRLGHGIARLPLGRRRMDGNGSAAPATRSTRRCRSTRSIWVPGCGIPRAPPSSSGSGSSRLGWSSTCSARASRTSS